MSATSRATIKRGHGTAESPLVKDLLAADSKPLPPALRVVGDHDPEPLKVPFSVFFSREIAALEERLLWSRVWQFACREEDIPNVGDRYRYDVGTRSYVVVRSAADRIQAFHNACLHRGTRLCSTHGSAESIRCPFHGWEWKLDGTLKSVPSAWDFPQLRKDAHQLPEVRVATWDGFVFLNPDPECGPLEATLGVLPEHFAAWPTASRFTYAHARKKIRANWKTVLGAFLEAYHVIQTHDDALTTTGDASTQYDVWDDGESHVSRLITPFGVPSPHLGTSVSAADAVKAGAEMLATTAGPGVKAPDVDWSQGGRAALAEWRRGAMKAAFGADFAHECDAMILDAIQYFLFPNFCPWLGEGVPLTYQFLPLGDDPDASIFDVRLLMPVPPGASRPPAAPAVELDFDEPFSGVDGFGFLGHIFDQDMRNIPNIQAGMKAAAPDRAFANLGLYQESRITHFHRTLDRWLGREPESKR